MKMRSGADMSSYELVPVALGLLCLRQMFRRLYFWVRLSVWRLFFGVFIITWLAAIAGFYHAVAEGLRDPDEVSINLRASFVTVFWAAALSPLLGQAYLVGVFAALCIAASAFGE
jgi:hypothetical protein